MIKEIIHDTFILQMRSQTAGEGDLQTAIDLLDTLKANSEHCVGMAANMIGVSKRIIVFNDKGVYTVMFNPEIIKCSGAYEAEEGCLSLSGTRKAKRYKSIKVKFENEKLQSRVKTYTDFTAQIIQHEIDHCNGILI
ncbi:MAG: peptide deformylase [Oscillospiraceae bacterium]|nr:peptide deformylase [Oscillospiraceae bacterium]